MRCSPASVSQAEVLHLAAIVDHDRSDEHRHQAIVALEERSCDVFLFAARTRFELVSTFEGQCFTLNSAEGRDPLRELDSDAQDGLMLKIFITGFEAVKARWWLRENCRFSPIRIDVDGERVDRGFDRGLFRQNLTSPLEGSLAITMHDVSPLLILLQHGVVSTRATMPGFLPFRAAVELGDFVEYGAPPMRLRKKVREFLPDVVDEAVAFLIRLVPRLPNLPSDQRHRISSVLLEAAVQGIRVREILQLGLIEIALPRGAIQMVCARELFEADEEFVVDAPTGNDVDERTLRVTDEARRHLVALGDVRFVRAPRRPRAGFLFRFRRLRRSLISAIAGLRRNIVPEDDLDDDELKLVNLLVSAGVRWSDGKPVRWCWSDAQRPLMLRRGVTAAIARKHRLARRLCHVVREDEAWITGVLLVLDEEGEFDLESIGG